MGKSVVGKIIVSKKIEEMSGKIILIITILKNDSKTLAFVERRNFIGVSAIFSH